MHSERIPPYAHRAARSIPVAVRRGAVLGAVLLAGLAGSRAAGADGAGGEAAAVVWPLDLPERYLTSNFMEYRPGRFHAGLDFKTRSRSGFVVRAVEDGWIARARATPGAYGRAVYLRGESGRTYVYAHLMRFNDAIRAELEAVRAQGGRYRVRREFEPGQMPVRAGDVLGLSGQAGTLGPHLHFEVRDAAQRPLDPQDEGYAVRDTFPPVIHHLRALPASVVARLGTGDQAMILERSDFGDPAATHLTLSGPVAFSARVTEQTDVRGHVLEPARIEVRLDGATVFRTDNERFSFYEVGLQRLEWLELPAEGERPALRERWLHRRPENTLPGRKGDRWYLGENGRGLEPGRHVLELTAWDHAGSRDDLRVVLEVLPPGAAGRAAGPGWRSEPIQTCIERRSGPGAICLQPLLEKKLRGLNEALLWNFAPQRGDPVLAPVQVLTRWEALDEAQYAAAAAQGLSGGSRQLRIAAADWPLDGDLVFGFEAPTVAPAAGEVYSWDGDEWDYEGRLLAPAEGSGTPRIGISRRRPHAVFADRARPRFPEAGPELVFAPGAASPDPAVTLPRWEILPVALVDDGAGVDPASIEAELDGRRLIVEPDLLRDRILVELPDTCSGGPYRLRVRAADRAGNAVGKAWSVRCRAE